MLGKLWLPITIVATHQCIFIIAFLLQMTFVKCFVPNMVDLMSSLVCKTKQRCLPKDLYCCMFGEALFHKQIKLSSHLRLECNISFMWAMPLEILAFYMCTLLPQRNNPAFSFVALINSAGFRPVFHFLKLL